MMAAGQDLVGTSAVAHAQLSQMAQMEPRYERNLAKLCSFFARGECNRGSDCPFRHEMPKARDGPMSNQSTKNRFYGTSDPVANKILGRKRRQEQLEQKEEEDYEKARATLYVRLRGDAPYPELTTELLQDMFYSYGEIVSIKVQPEKGQAFIEFTTPEATQWAISATNQKEMLERKLYVAWARATKRGSSNEDGKARNDGAAPAATAAGPTCQPVRVLAPPTSSNGSSPQKQSANPAAKVPAGLKVKPPAAVAALVAARRRQQAAAGGGPIRRAGGGPTPSAAPYPSANPNRLGTKRNLPPPPSST